MENCLQYSKSLVEKAVWLEEEKEGMIMVERDKDEEFEDVVCDRLDWLWHQMA